LKSKWAHLALDRIHLNPKPEFQIYYWMYPHVQKKDLKEKLSELKVGLVQNGMYYYITHWRFEGGFPQACSDV
jgi:hypothetical protein